MEANTGTAELCFPGVEEMRIWRWTHSPYDPRWSADVGGDVDAVEFGCFGHRPEALLTPTPHLPNLGTLTPPTHLAPAPESWVGWWGEDGWGLPQTPTPVPPQAYWATPCGLTDSLSTGESVSPPPSDAGAAPCSDSSPEPSVGEPDSFEDSLPTLPFASRDPLGRQIGDGGGDDGAAEEGAHLHPCIRVWGECKYGDTCVFAQTPREYCVFCLRRAVHKKCDGMSPPDLPALPDEVAARVADHALERQKHQKERRAKRRATKRREARIQAREAKRGQKELANSTPVPERRHSV